MPIPPPQDIVIRPKNEIPLIEFTGSYGGTAKLEVTPSGDLQFSHAQSSASTTFFGPTKHSAGMSGSLQALTDGSPYLLAGQGITISTSSISPVGQITLESTGEGKFGNTIIVLKTSGGKYPSLQNAVDSASSGDTILVGAGNWGVVTLKAGISIMGLQPPLADEVVLSKLTFSPSSGDAATNTVFISNLRISDSSSNPILELGSLTAPVRITMTGVRVHRNNPSPAGSMCKMTSDSGDTTTSIYMKNCMFTHESGDIAVLMESSARYLDLENCQFFNGYFQLYAAAGTISCSFVRFETAATSMSIDTQPGAQLLIGNSLIRNLGTDSTGILLYSGVVCAITDTVFDISSGTGSVIAGSGGVLVKNNLTVQPAALGARNTTISPSITQLSFQTL